MQANIDLLKEGIDNYRIIRVYTKDRKSGTDVTKLIQPHLIINHEDYVYIHGINAETNYLSTDDVGSIDSIELTDALFEVKKEIKYRSFGGKVLAMNDAVDLYENEGNADDDDYLDEYFQQPCIYCGEDFGCEHVLYLWDFCDSYCGGGRIDEIMDLRKIVEETFGSLPIKKTVAKFRKNELPDELKTMWESVEFDSDGSFEIEPNTFIEFIRFLTNQINTEELVVIDFASGGGCGNDDPLQVCYAKYPDRIIPLIEQKIRTYLSLLK